MECSDIHLYEEGRKEGRKGYIGKVSQNTRANINKQKLLSKMVKKKRMDSSTEI